MITMTMPPRSLLSRKPFVILALPRTGSTLLTTLLDSHPQIICHNEPFNPNGVYVSHEAFQIENIRAYRDEDPVRFTDLLYSVDRAERIVGFKILEYQAPDVQDHLLRRSDVRKVILRRENLLASYSSNLIANEVKQWRATSGDQILRTTIEFDPRKFDDYVKHVAQFERHINELIELSGSPMMALEYEEVLRRETHEKLLAFLGADPAFQLQTDVIRQNPGSLRKRFVDWDQVVAALAGTSMEGWMQDD